MSKIQTAEGQCDKCYARILWATNSASSSGARVPLNLPPQKAGSIRPLYTLDEINVICRKLELPEIEKAIEKERRLYTNHLVTCTKRGQK